MLKFFTLSDFSRNWLEYLKPHIKESTFIKYHNLLENYIIPELGDYSPDELSYGEIESFCGKLLLEGGASQLGLSPKTVQDTMTVLKQIFKYTRSHSDLVLPDISDLRVKTSPHELRVFSHSEQDKLCDYIFLHPDTYAIGIMICLFMGLRVGEVCALQWNDVSMYDRTIHINKTMQRLQLSDENPSKTSVQISTPKSPCANRLIPIPDAILPFIKKHMLSEDGFLLTNTPCKFIEPRRMQRHFKDILDMLGIEGAGFHTLRHTFATRCIEVGMDAKCLSEILGHSTVTMTLNRYVHPTLEFKRDYMNLLS